MIIGEITETDMAFIPEFQPLDWPDILPQYDYYLKKPFCYPIKILIDKKIAGIGVGISFGETAWLAHLIVKSEYRRKGVGGFLVDYLCNHLGSLGASTISLTATRLGYPVYKKAGFMEQTEYIYFFKDSFVETTLPSNRIRFSGNECIEEILLLDRSVSGENRRPLILDKVESAFVYQSGGKTAGCYFPELGDGLVIADNDEAGTALMDLRCAGKKQCVLPIENISGIKFLEEKGFAEIKRTTRMILGKTFLWRPEKLFNRIAGNVG